MTEPENKTVTKKNHCCFNSGNFLTAVLLVLAGIILLLNNFNLIPWNVWNTLWKFWPVVLIIWGLEAISGKKVWGRIIVIFIALIILSFITAFSVSKVNQDFDNWLKAVYPQWEAIEKQLPDSSDNQFNLPFNQKGKKVFRCDPVTGDCKAIYK